MALWKIGWRLLAGLLPALVVALAFYALAALAFALLPAGGRQQQGEGEPLVYVCASLAHTDIILPSRDPLIDWRGLFPAAVPPELPAEAALAFGWGDLRFFQETPNWSDMRLSTAVDALLGRNETALRIVPVRVPVGNPHCIGLGLDRAGRQALVAHIKAQLLLGADGRPIRRPGGQDFESYYLTVGRYGPFNTCNQWAAEALAVAGLPHARFAPFSFGVSWPLSAVATNTADTASDGNAPVR